MKDPPSIARYGPQQQPDGSIPAPSSVPGLVFVEHGKVLQESADLWKHIRRRFAGRAQVAQVKLVQ